MEGDGEITEGVEERVLGSGEARCVEECGDGSGGFRGCRLVGAGVVLGAAADGDVLDEGSFCRNGEGILSCYELLVPALTPFFLPSIAWRTRRLGE